MNPAIVVIAFNRPSALRRMLHTLDNADYTCVPHLVISLEGGAPVEVVDVATEFSSDKFQIHLIRRQVRLGLREHVLACGDLSEEYGSVIILEDDILVDRYFYHYASEALKFYEFEECVAGVSLYSYELNEFCGLPFNAMRNGYSTYFMQVVSSWGQCWSFAQWKAFKSWYRGKDRDAIRAIDKLPEAVKSWPETSWKKYFHGYIVQSKKYFVYPYESYSTNCSDEGGTHIKGQSNIFQICMSSPVRPVPNFLFCPVGNHEVVYDSFMEPIGDFVWRALDLSSGDVEMDIQGSKPKFLLEKRRYAVTPRSSKSSIAGYRFNYRPVETNLLFPVPVNAGQFNLCLSSSLCPQPNHNHSANRFSYYAKIQLLSRGVLLAIFRTLPSLMVSKFFGIYHAMVTERIFRK